MAGQYKQFDYNTTYYKILADDLTHFNITYTLGLNEDHNKFTTRLCTPGGLHFVDIKNLLKFIHFGPKIGIVKIPLDAQVYEEKNKLKADKIELLEIKDTEEEILELYKLSKEHGCPWSKWVCNYAARYGYFEILKWARGNGCPWSDQLCSYATKYNHLEILKWAVENGCPLTERICSLAIDYGNLEIFKWGIINGCPLDVKKFCDLLEDSSKLKYWKFIKNNLDKDFKIVFKKN